jgi:hypothetical protein
MQLPEKPYTPVGDILAVAIVVAEEVADKEMYEETDARNRKAYAGK